MMNYVEDCELFSKEFGLAMHWHCVEVQFCYYRDQERFEDFENMLLMGGEMG